MAIVLETNRTETVRDTIRASIGRKTPDEIRTWVDAGDDRGWAVEVADKLAASGYLTLADVTDSEFDSITA